jgi:dihydroorotase
MKSLVLSKPDDWHCHLRDDDALQLTVTHQAKQFARAIVMPNLATPVATVSAAQAYQKRILAQLPNGKKFTPLMTLYLTADTSESEIRQARECTAIQAFKLYPAGATTRSAAGISDLASLGNTLELLQEYDIPLLLHGEVADQTVDIFDREKDFIDRYLSKWAENYPKLRFVLEHISTAYATEFVAEAGANVAATITAHHLLINRNDLLAGGLKPHNYCLPVVKTALDQSALIAAATSGNPKFFLGTDSAPHPRAKKESACGCAGIYTAHAAMELYATVFDQVNALDKLQGFACEFGANYYRLPHNQQKIRLVRQPQIIPKAYAFSGETLIPFAAGTTLPWQLQEVPHE